MKNKNLIKKKVNSTKTLKPLPTAFYNPIIVDKYIKFDIVEIYRLDKWEGECERRINIGKF
ncbi:MAG: hypothetical protein EPN82_03010 [Bacteroidetes bacterium]|nr:MAG: hypothetical protein EPN82_03010 [Bacteroidota bacterium]